MSSSLELIGHLNLVTNRRHTSYTLSQHIEGLNLKTVEVNVVAGGYVDVPLRDHGNEVLFLHLYSTDSVLVHTVDLNDEIEDRDDLTDKTPLGVKGVWILTGVTGVGLPERVILLNPSSTKDVQVEIVVGTAKIGNPPDYWK